MTRYLLDTNVLLYARGREHPYREPCRAVLAAARNGLIDLEASVEVVQEFAHVLLRRSHRSDTLDEIAEVQSLCRLIDFDADVLRLAVGLLRKHRPLGVRDAVHAASAVHAGIERILSTDRVFDRVDQVVRVDPAETPWLNQRG